MKPQYSRNAIRIAFVGNYLPRQCGIATFTTHLCESMAVEFPLSECIALAMNDRQKRYDYPARVRFDLDQEDLQAYERAAEYLNMQDLDVVCLQHEFGIYGGAAGSHILTLIRKLKAPLVTTLHTVLANPNPEQRAVMNELALLSSRLVVMSQRAVKFLREIYAVPEAKIDLIPHGIPDIPFAGTGPLKKKFGLEGKNVLLTFGLLSPNKGLEYVIQALPAVLEKYPDTVYIALGATHPHVKEEEGEAYRESLKELAHTLGVEDHIRFEDRFVSQEELVDYIAATDIYITPYINPAQIVSGTLAYTIGAGKQVISTPYWYAEELLADGRGILVPFRDAKAISNSILELLGNESLANAIRQQAYIYGRNMIWPRVAERYMQSFEKARRERLTMPHTHLELSRQKSSPMQWDVDLPSVNLAHLLRMTDSTGILQHAVFDLPNYAEGYCTDDNARALILALALDQLNSDYYMNAHSLASRYLAFLWYAFNPDRGRFHNFLSYERRWLDVIGSDDSHGRALWALGAVLPGTQDEGMLGVAARLFQAALPAVMEMKSPRAWAFSLLGMDLYLEHFPGDRAADEAGSRLAGRLVRLYKSSQRPGWYWYEDIVTYNNATLPHALLLSAARRSDPEMMQIALESLQWLTDQQTGVFGQFAPVGSNGFYPFGGVKARFDQQPIEASAMVLTCLDAYHITGDDQWRTQARIAFEWFLGHNDLGLPLFDAESGGCYDGLHVDRPNRNQGAESTLAWLTALTGMYLIESPALPKEHARNDYSLLFNRRSSSE